MCDRTEILPRDDIVACAMTRLAPTESIYILIHVQSAESSGTRFNREMPPVAPRPRRSPLRPVPSHRTDPCVIRLSSLNESQAKVFAVFDRRKIIKVFYLIKIIH